MPARRVSTTRRGALGGALGLALLSACDVDDLRPPEDEAPPSAGNPPSTAPSTAPSPTVDPDTALVDRVVTEMTGVAVLVEGARLLPRLRRVLAPLDRMHVTHLGVLEARVGDPTPTSPPSVAAGLRRVGTAEQALQRTLAAAAVEAQSGALARLLASMAASVSQHLAVLTAEPTAAEGRP